MQNVTEISTKAKSKESSGIVMKYSELSQATLMTIDYLYKKKNLPLSVAMTTKKIFNQLQKAQAKITGEYQTEVVEKYMDKDAPKDVQPSQIYGFVPKKGTEEQLKKDHEDFGDKTFTFDGFRKYKLMALEGSGVSSQDLEAIEMFIEEEI